MEKWDPHFFFPIHLTRQLLLSRPIIDILSDTAVYSVVRSIEG